jgi:phage-related protein
MALETFTPSLNPSYSSSEDKSYRALTAQMGDGYRVVAQDGLNAERITVNLIWDNITEAQLEEFLDFFDARGAWEAFYYILPRELYARIWRIVPDSIKHQYNAYNNYNLNVTFQEEFDLV